MSQLTIGERIEMVHRNWLDPETREIWIHGVDVEYGYDVVEEPGVEYMMANKVIKNLHILKQQSSTKRVTIHLHSCGGEWDEGISIYNAIRAMPYPKTIIGYSHIRSMSSIIFLAADKVKDKRKLMEDCYFMFHYGTFSMEAECKTVHSNVEYDKRCNERMIDIYANAVMDYSTEVAVNSDRIKVRELIRKQMDSRGDVYLSAEEAIKWGFADEILTSF